MTSSITKLMALLVILLVSLFLLAKVAHALSCWGHERILVNMENYRAYIHVGVPLKLNRCNDVVNLHAN